MTITDAKRMKDWEKRAKAVIEKHMALPSKFGVSDCYLIADDMVEAVTGHKMFPVNARKYTTEQGAAKKLAQYGFKNVEEAFASVWESINPHQAHRGDIGIYDNNGSLCGGAFTAQGFMSRDETRVVFLPASRVKIAFKVGR